MNREKPKDLIFNFICELWQNHYLVLNTLIFIAANKCLLQVFIAPKHYTYSVLEK